MIANTLRGVEAEVYRLIDGMDECDRLDRAAGDPVAPRMKISEWIAARMQEAADAALYKEPRP